MVYQRHDKSFKTLPISVYALISSALELFCVDVKVVRANRSLRMEEDIN